jgi:hypothetical protein
MGFFGLFDIFRRPAPIRDAAELADFVDQNAAFLVQKGIYEYARARAGHNAKVLFREPEFVATADQSRWRAYPLGLALVGELVEGMLRPADDAQRLTQAAAINELVLAVFDRYPVPPALDAPTWSALRSELAGRLRLIGLHPPKRAKDIPAPLADAYFDLMPIHERLRVRDAEAVHAYLRVTMINIHDQLTKRIDVAAVVEALRTGPPPSR